MTRQTLGSQFGKLVRLLSAIKAHPTFAFLMGAVCAAIIGTFMAGRVMERVVAKLDELDAAKATMYALREQVGGIDHRLNIVEVLCPQCSPRGRVAP